MNVSDRFADTLEPVGIVAGVLLVLVGLTTIAGQPWATKGDTVAVGLQVVAALLTAGIGVALVLVSHSADDSIAGD